MAQDKLSQELEQFMEERGKVLDKVMNTPPNCKQGRHILGKNHNCKNCHQPLCTHTTFNLRGCMKLSGHTDPHFNAWSCDGFTWTNKEGTYVNNHEEWCALIDQLGKTRH